ncbi:zinc ribbon domain-containing protein [Candidatus Parvarchaeota archaeon]|nr:zinc ribbon domain-containing protein [Candidatus Parvarchaeota archaeon]
MLNKNCRFCGEKINKKWRFCPQCGRPVNAQAADVQDIAIDMTKVFQQVVPQIFNGIMGSVFQKQNHDHKNQGLNSRFGKDTSSVEEVVEPEDIISEHGDTVVHSINLPGIKSKSDIAITKMENSLEVRAIMGKRLYLKIIKRDKQQGLLSEEFVNGNLVLVLKRY